MDDKLIVITVVFGLITVILSIAIVSMIKYYDIQIQRIYKRLNEVEFDNNKALTTAKQSQERCGLMWCRLNEIDLKLLTIRKGE